MERLPPEILIDIFLKALPDPFDEIPPPYQASISIPLYISHVCRAWRSLALSTSHLWSYLCLQCTPTKGERAAEIFDTFLPRTAGAPLNYAVDIFMAVAAGEHDMDAHSCYYIMTTMLSQQRRWQNVRFCWYYADTSLPLDFPRLEMIDMPMLESMLLSFQLGPTAAKINVARSPLLRKIDVSGSFTLVAGETPLAYLREPSRLHFRGQSACSFSSCLSLLKAAPSLMEFHVTFLNLNSLPRTDPPVLLPNLRALNLDHNIPVFFIDSVTLPSLEALHLSSPPAGDKLLDFFKRSLPPLTYLDVRGGFAHEDALIPTLCLLPALKTLQISDASVSRQFFHHLTLANDTGVDTVPLEDRIICPKLESLHLTLLSFTEDRAACIEALIEMLKSRAKIKDSFKSICYDNDIGSSRVVSVFEIDQSVEEELGLCFEDGGWAFASKMAD